MKNSYFCQEKSKQVCDMKRFSLLCMALVLTAIFGIATAQNTQWYGFARTCFNGENWQNKFITFTAQNPNEVQAVSETLPELWAATYLDGYVWFVTQTRSLCKAPFDSETQTIGAYETVVPSLEPHRTVGHVCYFLIRETIKVGADDNAVLFGQSFNQLLQLLVVVIVRRFVPFFNAFRFKGFRLWTSDVFASQHQHSVSGNAPHPGLFRTA